MHKGKQYIHARGSMHQDTVDNWLLMIPANQLSSNAKIVYQVLKKMQDVNGSSQTDSHSWYKISGLIRADVDKALFELEKFGLIEFYFSPKSSGKSRSVCTNYLLYHPLMKDRYPIVPCPHNSDSLPNPMVPRESVRGSRGVKAAEQLRQDYGLPTIKEDIENVENH